MQTRTLLIYLMLMVFSCGIAFAQDEAAAGNDSTALPVIEYGSMPRKYEIADISISGADNYEDFVLIGYSGLAVGDIISVPGDEVTNATKRFLAARALLRCQDIRRQDRRRQDMAPHRAETTPAHLSHQLPRTEKDGSGRPQAPPGAGGRQPNHPPTYPTVPRR